MGKKYIVEIGRLERLYKAFIGAHGKPGITWLSPEVDLTPYTEPDMEQVRKEAYEEGYKTAKVQCNIQAEKDLREVGERHYQKGLSDAWEAARKVTQVRKYGGYGDCLEEVFGRHRVPWDVFDYSASEAIEKIRQYEQEKEERIQVGDEIETPSGLKGYVVNFTDDELVHYVSSEGRFGTMGTSAVSKTGRHFPEIAAVLQKMKES